MLQEIEDQILAGSIVEVHYDSRGTHGALRVNGELRIGLGLLMGHKRVSRVMRGAGMQGASHRH